MKRNKLFLYALIGGGLYYLWSKSQTPSAPAATVPATAAPTTTVAGFGHGTAYGPMGYMGHVRGQW